MVNYDVDDAGRTNKIYVPGYPAYADLTSAVGITNGYTPDGRISQMKLGSLYDTRDYRTPGMPTAYRLGTSLGADDRVRLEYNFDGTGNNGNVRSHRIVYGAKQLFFCKFILPVWLDHCSPSVNKPFQSPILH